jgi:C1A family cysteine protease
MMSMSGFSLRHDQTPVRDQGDRKTCAVFAVTAAHEATRSDGIDLSEECALWSANRISGGAPPHSTVANALAGIRADGQARESDWRYGNPPHPAKPPPAAAKKENRFVPGSWRQLSSLKVGGLEQILREGEAVMLTIAFVRQAWSMARDDGFVDAAPGQHTETGHAVLATGIGKWHSGATVIEFKNSWDSDWGDDGYGYLSQGYWTRYGRKAFALSVAA